METLEVGAAAASVGSASQAASAATATLSTVEVPTGVANSAAGPRLDDAAVALQAAVLALTGVASRLERLSIAGLGAAFAYDTAESEARRLFEILFPSAGAKSLAPLREGLEVAAVLNGPFTIADHGDDTAAIMDDLEELSPAGAAAAWGLLSPAQRDALVRDYPSAIGNLGGVALADRARANQGAAQRAEANGLEGYPPATQEAIRQIASGQIQAVQFRPSEGELVQMIGTPSESTEHLINYAPGTYATMGDFAYDANGERGTFGALDAILAQHPDTVAFVYVNDHWADQIAGRMDADNSYGEHGHWDANAPHTAAAAGLYVDGFTDDAMRSDPALREARRAGVGHSFGHSVITASEMEGTRYDSVVALAGSNTVPRWSPHEGTSYVNIQFTNDALDPWQPFVYGGAGMNPDFSPSYEQRTFDHFYRVEGAGCGYTGSTESHNRIVNGPSADPYGMAPGDWNGGPIEAASTAIYGEGR